jgi:hypothetical protein
MDSISNGRSVPGRGLCGRQQGTGGKRRVALRSLAFAVFVAALGQLWLAPGPPSAATWRYDMYDGRRRPVSGSRLHGLCRHLDPDDAEHDLRQDRQGVHPPGVLSGEQVHPAGPAPRSRGSVDLVSDPGNGSGLRARPHDDAVDLAGTDPHGWRNGLNYFGWGSIESGFYADRAYTSFDAAAKAVVHSMAVYGKPAGILAWYGGHAQFVTGYTVTGADPRTGSMAFTLTGVYLTDPLKSQAMRDKLADLQARGGTSADRSPSSSTGRRTRRRSTRSTASRAPPSGTAAGSPADPLTAATGRPHLRLPRRRRLRGGRACGLRASGACRACRAGRAGRRPRLRRLPR